MGRRPKGLARLSLGGVVTWIKMDDRFPDDPKVAALTDGAYRLWTTGIAYCSRHLTDGKIAEQVIGRWGVKHPDRAASELVAGGLWRSNANGYEVVNYLKFQRSREQIEDLKVKRAEAGSRGGRASASSKQGAAQLPAPGLPLASDVRDPDDRSQKSDAESSSSSVTAGPLGISADDDDVLTALASLRLAARKSPDVVARKGQVNDDRAWMDRAKRRDCWDGELLVRLRALRESRPDADPGALARYLFDNTKPAEPLKAKACPHCNATVLGSAGYVEHLEVCPGEHFEDEERLEARS